MEPQLISRKAIKIILKKNYFLQNNLYNKSFSSFINNIKLNWIPIVIILLAIILLIHLYVKNTNKKETLVNNFKELKQEKKNVKYDDFKSKENYESEYYKMLPRVTSNPEVINYMY
jgi:hypothetical protein